MPVAVAHALSARQIGQYGVDFDRQPAQMAHFEQVLPGCTQADVIGSPYAVTNYTCNKAFGRYATNGARAHAHL